MAKATTGKKKTFRKKEKKNIPVGIVHISASFNNTLISITDTEGNLVAQSSSGARGFRGSRKGTPFAAQQAAYEAANKAKEVGMQQAEVHVKGPGGGRESAIRAINSAGIRVTTIRDTTPIPHNGCRPRSGAEFNEPVNGEPSTVTRKNTLSLVTVHGLRFTAF